MLEPAPIGIHADNYFGEREISVSAEARQGAHSEPHAIRSVPLEHDLTALRPVADSLQSPFTKSAIFTPSVSAKIRIVRSVMFRSPRSIAPTSARCIPDRSANSS